MALAEGRGTLSCQGSQLLPVRGLVILLQDALILGKDSGYASVSSKSQRQGVLAYPRNGGEVDVVLLSMSKREVEAPRLGLVRKFLVPCKVLASITARDG